MVVLSFDVRDERRGGFAAGAEESGVKLRVSLRCVRAADGIWVGCEMLSELEENGVKLAEEDVDELVFEDTVSGWEV